MNTAGLSTDQAPPLAVPLSFYAFVPLAMIAAGVLLIVDGGSLLLTSWLPRTIAVVHVGTIGVLLSVMLGSLYQMVPVVAGSKVPFIRLSHVVAAALGLGAVALVYGLWSGTPGVVRVATYLLGSALFAFVVPVSIALARARGGETLFGMRVAMGCLVALAVLGLRLAWGHSGAEMPLARTTFLVAHVSLALIGWVGGLITAVSWQVVPMFYLTAEFPKRRARIINGVLLASMTAVFVAALFGSLPLVIAAAIPGAVTVWVVQPLSLALLIKNRRRRRKDPTLQFWWVALASAPLVLVAALATWLGPWTPSTLLLGWLAIVGWAGATVHGMLTRIVPFLVWFHRFASLAGLADVPPMKQLLPDQQVRVQLVAHAVTLAVGALAIALQQDLLARIAGSLLAITGALLGFAIASVLWRARPQ